MHACLPDTDMGHDGDHGHGCTDAEETASVGHVIARLAVLELRTRAAVARRRAEQPGPQDPRFRGLHLGDDDIDRLLAATPLRGVADEPATAQLLADVEGAADLAEQRGERLRLRELARSFGLDELDVDLLLAAAAPDVDARFERLYAYLHDDVSRRRVSVGLALELARASPFSAPARSRCAAGARLGAAGLVVIDEPSRPLLSRELRVPDRVVAHLLGDGDDAVDPAVAPVVTPALTAASGAAPPISVASAARLTYLRDLDGTAEPAAIAAALAEHGVPSLAIDVDRVVIQPDPAATLRLVTREARLSGRVIVAGPIDALAERDLAALRLLAEAPCRVVLVGRMTWEPRWSWAVPHTALATPLSREQAIAAWSARLDDAERDGGGLDDAALASLADRYRLGPGQIERAVTAGRAAARARGGELTIDALRAGARAQNAAGLERFAVRIEPAVSWDDLVLPAATITELRHVASRARHEHVVVASWGVRPPGRRRRGSIVLFAGDSGTGKTMAAEVLAADLGLDLYQVNLATVIDKYIGETEKNLERILAEADGVNGVLLFDEADALLGKRSEVSDAHDRYANIEVAYLLQLLDSFEGIAVLTTNLRANLDEAFTRRLDAIVDFPVPGEGERLRLWRHALGPGAPLGPDVDLPFCASSFRLTGGSIRAIAVSAAFLAAAAQRPVSMSDLIRATRREYRKLGRLCTASEFGPHLHDDDGPDAGADAPVAGRGVESSSAAVPAGAPQRARSGTASGR